MKTSNKLILGLFLVAVLLPVLVIATIVVKYRSGNFIWTKTEGMISHSFPGKTQVTVRGLEMVDVVYSDSLYAEVQSGGDYLPVKISELRDSVLIYGDTSYYNYDTLKDGSVSKEFVEQRSGNRVVLYLPADIVLSAVNCESIYLKSADPENQVQQMRMRLYKSTLISNAYYDSTRTPFKSFYLELDRSVADLSSLPPIGDIEISLTDSSELLMEELAFGTGRLTIDSLSRIKATGNQLKKIIQKK